MKVRLTEDEWYPVLTPERREDWMTDEDWAASATEVPDEVVVRWELAEAEMNAAISELRKYYPDE